MKYTFAFFLIALFAVISISQALPYPEDASADAATGSNDDEGEKSTIELDIKPADVEAMGRLNMPWGEIVRVGIKAGMILKDILERKKV
uniref:Uncharacterized protein n=1 Tax=Anopheles funestus TaxID=62324 RepID=A0A182R3L0_ANOFN